MKGLLMMIAAAVFILHHKEGIFSNVSSALVLRSVARRPSNHIATMNVTGLFQTFYDLALTLRHDCGKLVPQFPATSFPSPQRDLVGPCGTLCDLVEPRGPCIISSRSKHTKVGSRLCRFSADDYFVSSRHLPCCVASFSEYPLHCYVVVPYHRCVGWYPFPLR